MNLASALTGGFAEDIKVNQATINLGNQLMFAAVVVFEIPCNMALQRVSGILCSCLASLLINKAVWSPQMDVGPGIHVRRCCDNADFCPQPNRILG